MSKTKKLEEAVSFATTVIFPDYTYSYDEEKKLHIVVNSNQPDSVRLMTDAELIHWAQVHMCNYIR